MIRGDGLFFILLAFWLLILPLQWVLSAAAAAMVHECCHILAVRLLKGKILSIHVGITGCRIQTGPMGDWASVLSILAGPLGSFLLLLFRKQFPMIAVWGFLQGVYNLLPVMPLDGGRILRCLLGRFCPDRMEGIMSVLRILVFLVGILGIVLVS